MSTSSGSAASPSRTDSWRVSPPGDDLYVVGLGQPVRRRAGSGPRRPRPAGRPRRRVRPSGHAAIARTACTRIGTPPRVRSALGAPGPSRTPRPAAGMTAATVCCADRGVVVRFVSLAELGIASTCRAGHPFGPFREAWGKLPGPGAPDARYGERANRVIQTHSPCEYGGRNLPGVEGEWEKQWNGTAGTKVPSADPRDTGASAGGRASRRGDVRASAVRTVCRARTPTCRGTRRRPGTTATTCQGTPPRRPARQTRASSRRRCVRRRGPRRAAPRPCPRWCSRRVRVR